MQQFKREHYIYTALIAGILLTGLAMYLFFHSKSKSIMGVVEVSEFQVRAHQDIRVVELRVK